MAKLDIDFTYATLNQILGPGIKQPAELSKVLYNKDYAYKLEHDQRVKHEFIADQLNIHSGSRVLEMGCYWGAFLQYIKANRGAKGIGVTFSESQYKNYQKKGLDAYIKDCRKVRRADFGSFDAVVSMREFENVCSVDEFKCGKQEKVYSNFFKNVASLLPVGGRFYLQTLAFTPKMLPTKPLGSDTDKSSDASILALAVKQLPGSWLPYGSGMVIRNAANDFKVVSISSGRNEYIETISQWRKIIGSFTLKKYGLYFKLLLQLMKDKEFRHILPVFRTSPLQLCFERGLMDHFRIVFEKV